MDGEIGELVIKSRYVALGYWRDPDATARRFAIDPIDPETRIYKTGDLARRRPNGLFEYIGRKDDQIKLRGHQIEPSEIATKLRDYAGVRDAFVMAHKNVDGSVRSLAAYVEARPDIRDLSPRDLKAMLKDRLPPYMIPASIQLIDQLPRLPNLKIDRSRLGEIDAGRAKAALDHHEFAGASKRRNGAVATGGLEEAPTTGHSAILGNKLFRSLGGDLLAAAQLISAVEERFCCELPLQAFFDTSTLAMLCQLLRDAQSLPSANSACHEPKTRLLRMIQAYTGSWKGARLFPDSLVVGRNIEGS